MTSEKGVNGAGAIRAWSERGPDQEGEREVGKKEKGVNRQEGHEQLREKAMDNQSDLRQVRGV